MTKDSKRITQMEERVSKLEAVLERVIERDKAMAGQWWPTLEGPLKKIENTVVGPGIPEYNDFLKGPKTILYTQESMDVAIAAARVEGRREVLAEVWEKMITKLGKPLSHSEANVYTKLWDECRAAYEKHQKEDTP